MHTVYRIVASPAAHLLPPHPQYECADSIEEDKKGCIEHSGDHIPGRRVPVIQVLRYAVAPHILHDRSCEVNLPCDWLVAVRGVCHRNSRDSSDLQSISFMF